jgi:hypothetical protein
VSTRKIEATMTVYVDSMKASFGRMTMCHMIADDEDELHAMADRIGVARKWHQINHYDICMSKRKLAVAAGAVEITFRQAGCMTRRQVETGVLGDPGDAEEWFRQQTRKRAERAAAIYCPTDR